MKSFSTASHGRTFVIGLEPGDYVLESVNELIERENITDAVVAGGIGTLDYCVLHMITTTGYPPAEHFARWEDSPLELAAMNGTIVNKIPHIHAVVSDTSRTWSGHLEPGCRILYRGEMVITELPGMNINRVKNDKGVPLLGEK